MKPTRTHRPLSRRRWVLFFLAAGLLGLIGYWVLGDWLVQRAGPDFRGAPGQLVPADAALVARWPEASRFVDQASRLATTRALLGDSGLAELLLPPANEDRGNAGVTPAEDTEDTPDRASGGRGARAPLTSPSGSATRALAKRFVDTCLGGEAVVAVLPPLESAAPDARADATSATSALLIVTRTNAGFDENLAEFVAECYPELALETHVYRGCRLQRYNAKKTRHAFGYCRFGTTVALVLRSADWRRLEAVVDQRLEMEHAGPTAEDAAATTVATVAGRDKATAMPDKHAWSGETAPWLAAVPNPDAAGDTGTTSDTGATAILYCDPRALPEALEALPAGGSDRKGKGKGQETPPGIAELLAIWCPDTAYVTATLRLGEKGVVLDTLWHGRAAGNEAANETPAGGSVASQAAGDSISDYLGTLPRSAPICLAVAWPELGARARATYERWVRAVWGKDVKDFESAFRKATQMRFDHEFLPQLGDFAGLGVMGVADNALLTVPRARMAMRLNDAASPATNAGTGTGTRAGTVRSPFGAPTSPSDESAGAALTMLGILAGARDGEWLRLGLNESPETPPARATQASGQAKTLLGNALLAQPPARPEGSPALSALVLADFDAVTPMLERTLAAMGLWSKKARRDADSWQTTLDLMRHLHALRLRAWREGDGMRVDLLVPMD